MMNKTLIILNEQKSIQNVGGTIRITPGGAGKRTMAIVNFWPSKSNGFDKTDYVEMPNNKQTFLIFHRWAQAQSKTRLTLSCSVFCERCE